MCSKKKVTDKSNYVGEKKKIFIEKCLSNIDYISKVFFIPRSTNRNQKKNVEGKKTFIPFKLKLIIDLNSNKSN